jgi:hypothetical protein
MKNSSYNPNSQLNDNMLEIDRTLHNLKQQQRNILNDIDDEEIYREKVILRLEESKRELNELNGILLYFIVFYL